MIKSLIISLILTIIIELITSIIMGIKNKRELFIIILINICTNPIIVYISNIIAMVYNVTLYWFIILIMEIIVVIVEWKMIEIYMEIEKKRAFKISLINNIVSFGIRHNFRNNNIGGKYEKKVY